MNTRVKKNNACGDQVLVYRCFKNNQHIIFVAKIKFFQEADQEQYQENINQANTSRQAEEGCYKPI